IEAAAAEVASRIREVESLSVVRVLAVRIAVVRRRLVRENRLRTVLGAAKARPYFVEAGLELVWTVCSHVLQHRDRRGVLARVDEHATLVCLCRPRGHASLVAMPRRQWKQLGRRIEILKELGRDLRDRGVRLAEV